MFLQWGAETFIVNCMITTNIYTYSMEDHYKFQCLFFEGVYLKVLREEVSKL